MINNIKYLISFVILTFIVFSCVDAEECLHKADFSDRCFDATCGLKLFTEHAAQPCDCTEDNIGYHFSECNNDTKTRRIIYFWKPPAVCTNVNSHLELPLPIDNIPCDINCGSGTFLNTSTLLCEECEPGSYSDGAVLHWEDWSNFPAQYTTTCIVGYENEKCSTWQVQGDRIDSGDNSGVHYLKSTLSLRINLVREGYVSFEYTVDAEKDYDGLFFKIDNVVIFFKSQVINYTTYSAPLTAGFHTIQWEYNKDAGTEEGLDKASIRKISVEGTSFGNIQCKKCAQGSYSNTKGATSCTLCDEDSNTIGDGSTYCFGCSADKYSFPGSEGCIERAKCNESDITYSLSPCVDRTQTKQYFYILPQACYEADFEWNFEPTEIVCSEASQCNPGQYYDSKSKECIYCPLEYYSDDHDAALCSMCPLGASTTELVSNYDLFDSNFFTEFPDFSTGCIGDCYSKGWRLGYWFIDSGVGNGEDSISWFQLKSEFISHGKIKFSYTLSCEGSYDYLLVTINEKPVVNIRCKGCNNDISHTQINVIPGMHTIRWEFRKKSDVSYSHSCDIAKLHSFHLEGVSEGKGGAVSCEACLPGSYAESGKSCVQCKAGFHTNEHQSSECEECPINTYAPEKGSDKCTRCGLGTHTTAPAANSCDFDCTYIRAKSIVGDIDSEYYETDQDSSVEIQDESEETVFGNYSRANDTSVFFDISQIFKEISFKNSYSNVGQNFNGTKEFHLGFCEKAVCNGQKNNPNINSFSCLIDEYGIPKDLGNHISFSLENFASEPKNEKDNYGLLISTLNEKNGCSLNLTIKCTLGDNFESIDNFYVDSANDEKCQYSFIWETEYGCPVCTNLNFQDIDLSDCDPQTNTKFVAKNYKYEKGNACNYRNSVHENSAHEIPCIPERKLANDEIGIKTNYAFAFIFITIISLITTIAVIGVCWYRKKKVEFQYSQILSQQDVNSSNLDLDG